AQAAVFPGVQVEQHALVALELRVTPDHQAAVADLPAQLFQDDAALAELAFEDLLNLDSDVGINTVLPLVEAAFDGQDFAGDDDASADDHLLVGHRHNGGCRSGLRGGQQANDQDE